jgi:Fe-S oxidoreductase
VFREELTNLYPNELNAFRLREQSYLLGDFLEKFAPDFQPGRLERKAVVHGHCHQKALLSMTGETRLLDRLGVRYELPDTGCCGMAGAFGFEAGEHYDVSIACGERSLLPAVRDADPETLIIADGFSCREQIRQTTDREALHLAEVLAMALKAEPGRGGEYPERAFAAQRRSDPAGTAAAVRTACVVGGAALLAGAAAWALLRRKTKEH